MSAILLAMVAFSLFSHCEPAQVTSDSKNPGKTDTTTFTCQGKTTCGQMVSCAEATYYVKHCPNVEIDGDNDGVPCESQWCL